MKHLAPWIPTILSAWLLAASIGYKRPKPTFIPPQPPKCYLDFTPHFDWEDSVYARNRAYFNSLSGLVDRK